MLPSDNQQAWPKSVREVASAAPAALWRRVQKLGPTSVESRFYFEPTVLRAQAFALQDRRAKGHLDADEKPSNTQTHQGLLPLNPALGEDVANGEHPTDQSVAN
jgi:hypothetical protein